MRKWAGVTYQSEGGEEVGRMVRALWDERGWECLWVSTAYPFAGLGGECTTKLNMKAKLTRVSRGSL